jgi:hypothetical protein
MSHRTPSARSVRGVARRPVATLRERGSAYIVALLALVVLTLIGLSLALISQTEMQIGANERTIQKIFYASDAGIAASVVKALAGFDYRAREYEFADTDTGVMAALNLRHEVETSPFFPILESPCNLCSINNAGEYGGEDYSQINYAVTAHAERVGGADDSLLAEKTVSAMVEVQPWQLQAEALEPLQHPELLAKIKY